MGLMIGGLAYAANLLSISPLDPVIESQQQATAVWLHNQSNEPIVMQIQVFNWQQQQFNDSYQDAQQRLIASPPMATIPPGKRQLIRLVRGQMGTPGQEEAFRLIIDEIPPLSQSTSQENSAGLQFQIRYSVPLFVAGDGIRLKPDMDKKQAATVPVLSAKLVMVAGKKYLRIHNSGLIHARLSNVVWTQGIKNITLNAGLLGYVLPGAQMQWPVPMPLVAEGELNAQVNDVATQIPWT
jgi:fimbrial chaperone protein